jgi:UDP:flavonoid glycosyltransferase YjiC (YdhE family)
LNKKALFIPNDLGGGLGHVRRCNLFAQILKERDWQIAFITHKKNTRNHINATNYTFYLPFSFDKWLVLLRSRINPVHFRPRYKLLKEPYFWEFGSLNYQVLRDGYFTPSIVQHRFRKLAQIVNQWKPDIIVGDGHLLSYFLGNIFGIPVFQLLRYAVFPDQANFIWWKKIPDTLIPPASVKVFLPLFDKIKEEPFQEASGLLKGDAYLIPGTPEVEPIETITPHLFYGYHIDTHWDERLIKIDKKKRLKKIYVTVGGGAKRTHVKEYYSIILSSLIKEKFQLIFSDPFEVLLSDKQNLFYPNLTLLKWVDSSTVFPYLNLIIHHGGYGTTMESLWWGIPSLIIPYHSEQEGNGRRTEKLRTGKILPIAREPYQPVIFDYYYGETTMLGGFDRFLNEHEINSTVKELISNDEYKNEARRQSQQLRSQFNSELILNFIRENS